MFLIIFFPGYNKPYSYQVEDFVCSAICTMQYNYYLHFLFLRKINHSYSAGRLHTEPLARPTAAGRWRAGTGPSAPGFRSWEGAARGRGRSPPSSSPSAPQQQKPFTCSSRPPLPLCSPCRPSAQLQLLFLVFRCAPPTPPHPCLRGAPRPCARAGQAGGGHIAGTGN